jgi:hypothetical protein
MRTKLWLAKPEGKRLLGRSRRRWKDNIKMHIRKIGLEVVDGINLVQGIFRWWALVNTEIILWDA